MKTELSLRDIFNEFREINGLTVAYITRRTGIPWTTLGEWACGKRSISRSNEKKIREFLSGNFLVTVDEVISYMKGEIR